MENPKYPRTQAQVSEHLALSKSTVSDAVRKFVKNGHVKPYGKAKRNVLYYAVKERNRLKSLIYQAELSNGGGVGPYIPIVRAHLSGGALWYEVENEGLRTVPAPDNPSEKTPLFALNAYNLKGSRNYTGEIEYDGERYGLRLMETATALRLAVNPPDIVMVPEEMVSESEVLAQFALSVHPLLDYLEKYDWRIKKEGRTYKHSGKLTAEYGADELVSDTLAEVLPEGVPGVSPVFFDKSPGSFGPEGEAESRNLGLVNAILTSDRTKADVRNLITDNARIWAELEETKAMLRTVAENQNMAVSYLIQGVQR